MNSPNQSTEQSGRKLKDQRQVKQTHSAHLTNVNRPEKPISELLSISKRNSPGCGDRSFLGSSPNKRMKRNHLSPGPDQTKILPQIVQSDDMYKLPSTNPRGGLCSDGRSKTTEIIEISDSPPSSPINPLRIHGKSNTPTKPTNSESYIGPKKLVIKNFKKTAIPDSNQYFDQVWTRLDAALRAIFRNERMPHSKEELYRSVENLCRQDRAPRLFKLLCEECKRELSARLKDLLVNEVAVMEDTDVLRMIIEAWLAWNTQLVNYS